MTSERPGYFHRQDYLVSRRPGTGTTFCSRQVFTNVAPAGKPVPSGNGYIGDKGPLSHGTKAGTMVGVEVWVAVGWIVGAGVAVITIGVLVGPAAAVWVIWAISVDTTPASNVAGLGVGWKPARTAVNNC